MQNFNDPIFWIHVSICQFLIMCFIIFVYWKHVKPEIYRILWMIRCGFIDERFNMQMDFISYAKHIKQWFPTEPDELQLEKIHDGIEAFRKEHEKHCDPVQVAAHVKDLYDIHNGKAIKNFEVTVQGTIMQSKNSR